VRPAQPGTARHWYAAIVVGGSVTALALGLVSPEAEYRFVPLFLWLLAASLPVSVLGLSLFAGPGRPWVLSAMWIPIGLALNIAWLYRRDHRGPPAE
jgi:hypothetical protein